MRTLLAAVLIAFAGAAQAQQKVVFGLVSPPGVGHGPLFIAKELGYWAEEGIDVQVVQFNGTAVLLPQIINKSVTVGFPNPDPLVLSRQPGKDPLPLQFFYNFIRENVWEFAVLADSPAKTLADLKGKKIGVGALTFGNIPLTRAMFKELGMESGKDYEFVPTGLGAPAFLALRDRRVDALNLFETMHTMLEQQGTAIRRLEMPRKYTEIFSNGLIAHAEVIRDNPAPLIAFGRVVAKGMVACNANRPACVRAFWKSYPEKKPAGDEAKAMARDRAQLDARFDKYIAFPRGEAPRWGSFPDGSWENLVQAMLDGGQIQTKDIDVGALYTNALVPAMNNFDTAAVIKAAQALK
jgi:NitT/TauT family transport system substrate-binding protein